MGKSREMFLLIFFLAFFWTRRLWNAFFCCSFESFVFLVDC
jgi:hypothetical protein